ncbi:Lactonase, 7-bladed beta-propeller-domain-containing protein [Mycena metata]|uniref:Lactonase, 7-bladed beta-propeller-domain-containing protein n=1 Tax=Mycena metata TaxID=1033252 RepID=A0AAD7JMP8_9AGAR|nr:Lactonase, 7-bladed beta-propeller-domain-containing protein [Mycena metata]
MVNFTILAGGFASFIATYTFDSDANTLSLTKQTETGTNPSWIASHPTNLSILYAVNELNPGGNLQSFTVDSTGGLQNIDNVTTGGNGPTFTVMLSTGEVTAMNFGSPNCSFVATVPNDPLHFERDSPVISFPIPAGAPSNPHMSLEFNDEVFVPDLGGDKIWRIVRNGAPGNFEVQGQIDIDKGAGPRHIAIHDNILFLVSETASTLSAHVIPAGPNGTAIPPIANVTTFPADALEGSKFAAAEILISTPTDAFPNPLIYVSNRNISPNVTDPAGDTIAIFEFINGTESSTTGNTRRMQRRVRRQDAGTGGQLKLIAQIPTGLQQIRSMALGRVDDGGDEFIIAGANTEGGVAVFQRVDGGRNLTLSARNLELGNRTSFVFVEPSA